MKRILAFMTLLGIAATVAFAGPTKDTAATAEQQGSLYTGGFWTPTKGDRQSFVVMNGDGQSAFLGFMRSANKSKACEFAIGVDRDRIHFQIVDEQGTPHFVPVTALLKLKEAAAAAPPAVSKSDAPAVGQVAGAITEDHKFIYALARTKAVAEYARTKGVSRAEARAKVDSLDDATLHAAVVKSGVFKITAQPAGGKLSDFLDWILAHQDQIAALVKLILSLLAFI